MREKKKRGMIQASSKHALSALITRAHARKLAHALAHPTMEGIEVTRTTHAPWLPHSDRTQRRFDHPPTYRTTTTTIRRALA